LVKGLGHKVLCKFSKQLLLLWGYLRYLFLANIVFFATSLVVCWFLINKRWKLPRIIKKKPKKDPRRTIKVDAG
jgi:cytochrome c biogenesis protein ResB